MCSDSKKDAHIELDTNVFINGHKKKKASFNKTKLAHDMLSNSTCTLSDISDINYSSKSNVPADLRRTSQKRNAAYSPGECPICLETTKHYTTLFPCGHKFHAKCLINWMKSQNNTRFTCSLCRQNIQYFVNNPLISTTERKQLQEVWNDHQYEHKISDQDHALNANAPIYIPQKQSKTKLLPINEQQSIGYSLNHKNSNNQNNNVVHVNNKDRYEYEPDSLQRARGNIRISHKLTTSIIPSLIRENIPDLYDYMDKMVATNNFCVYGQELCVIDYGFHDKNTNEILYCVANRQDKSKNRDYGWKMDNNLWTQQQITETFGIPSDQLPQMPLLNANIDMTIDFKQNQTMVSDTKWHKIPIFNKNANKIRFTLGLSKEQFIEQYKNAIKSQSTVDLIPILMFGNCGFRVEYVQIMEICHEMTNYIGISFVYANNKISVTGIHVDKNSIMKSHQLALKNHECHCLDEFVSIIDVLEIGNPDATLNKLKAAKKQIKALKKENEMLREGYQSSRND
eukprot:250458_1